MKPESGYRELNGTRLYYELAGSGRPLVLIHGFTLDTRMWDEEFEVFSETHQVLRYDLRGFGRSALPDASLYSHADDLKALLDALGLESAVVLGLSLGGAVALDFAVSYPEALSSLIVVDSALVGHDWQERPSDAVNERAREAGIEAAKALWLEHPLFAPAREQAAVSVRLKQMVDDYSGWHLVNDNPLRLPDPPTIEQLKDITAPTLVLVGDRDYADFLRISEILEERIPGARRAVISGAGHMSNMERPAEFQRLVSAFLEDSQRSAHP